MSINTLLQILIGIILTICVGIGRWVLLEVINNGKVLAVVQNYVADSSVRLADLEKLVTDRGLIP